MGERGRDKCMEVKKGKRMCVGDESGWKDNVYNRERVGDGKERKCVLDGERGMRESVWEGKIVVGENERECE